MTIRTPQQSDRWNRWLYQMILGACEEPFECELNHRLGDAMRMVVNQGIDSRLEGVTNSSFQWVEGKLNCTIDQKDLCIIVRRLGEAGDVDSTELREMILEELGIEEE